MNLINYETADVIFRELKPPFAILGYGKSYERHTGPCSHSGLDYWLTFDTDFHWIGKMTHTMDNARRMLGRESREWSRDDIEHPEYKEYR